MAAPNRPIIQGFEADQASKQALTGLSGQILPDYNSYSMINMFLKVRPNSVGLKALQSEMVDTYADAADELENAPYLKLAHGTGPEGVASYAAARQTHRANEAYKALMESASGPAKLPGFIATLSATGVKGLRK